MVEIYVLGAGTPTPTPGRFGSAHVLHLGDEFLMFDCGPAATHKLVKAGLFPTQIDYLFFTHHHFDHNVDYPCLLHVIRGPIAQRTWTISGSEVSGP